VGPKAVLDAAVKRKIPSLRRESNPRTPIVQVEVKNAWSYTSTVLIRLLGAVLN
jgi:hypothetical protein